MKDPKEILKGMWDKLKEIWALYMMLSNKGRLILAGALLLFGYTIFKLIAWAVT